MSYSSAVSMTDTNSWEWRYAYDFDGREIRYDQAGHGSPIVMVHGAKNQNG